MKRLMYDRQTHEQHTYAPGCCDRPIECQHHGEWVLTEQEMKDLFVATQEFDLWFSEAKVEK